MKFEDKIKIIINRFRRFLYGHNLFISFKCGENCLFFLIFVLNYYLVVGGIMSLKEKSLGREKAKENKFIMLGTLPADYEADHLNVSYDFKNCELCGQHIEYAFLLRHKGDKENKNLRVGSDCLLTFCATYLPNIAERLLEKMRLQMEAIVERRKAEVFQEKNPTFAEDCSKLQKSIREKLNESGLYSDFAYGKLKLPILETISDAQSDFRSKKYTTKPKVEEIYNKLSEVNSGKFDEKLIEYKENKESDKTIASHINEVDENTKKIYEDYIQLSHHMKWNKEKGSLQSKALSAIEIEIFDLNCNDYISKRVRNKKKLSKNKKEIFELIRKEISDSRLMVNRVEDRSSFSYISDANLKERIKEYEVYFERSRLGYIPSRFNEELSTYGLATIKSLFQKPIDHYAELGKAENHYIYTNEYILFKDTESGTRFVENLKTVVENKIQEIEDYLASEEFVTDEIN
jgi:hypothetical protein